MDAVGDEADVEQVADQAEAQQREGVGAREARPARAEPEAEQQRRGDRHDQVAHEQEAARR
jgi:hypothetical protein